MSSCYHICPSFEDFQFGERREGSQSYYAQVFFFIRTDSAFMYIISGLLIVKIFQTRHPDIHANAFVAFLCFAVVIFLTLIGIVSPTLFLFK